MSLHLDARQRAMLAEMGVRVWLPEPPSAGQQPGRSATAMPAVGGQGAAAAIGAAIAPAGAATVDSTPALTPEAAALDWPALRDAVAACQACPMCVGRRAPVLAMPATPARADWFILGEPPDDAQERAGAPFVGDAGVLLDAMLKAVGVARQGHAKASAEQPRAYLSLVLKCRPNRPTLPDAQSLQTCAVFLRRELALVQPKVILAMGHLAMQLLLSETQPQGLAQPLGKLRGQIWRYQGVPVVVTYPPASLLRNGQDKARAWEDLCLAADIAEGKAPTV